MPELLFATNNKGKRREILRLLGGSGWTALFPDALPDPPDVEETGTTFLENARLKAEGHRPHRPGAYVAAEDSGIVVPALGGEPGVYSARFGGRPDGAARNTHLLERMADLRGDDRAAYYQAVIVLLDPNGREAIFDGRVHGLVAHEPDGDGGFGYDPLFFHAESGCTFARLAPEEKDRLSHRGQAMRALAAHLKSLPHASAGTNP